MIDRRTLHGLLLVGILLAAVTGMLLFRGGTTSGGRITLAGVALSDYLEAKQSEIDTLAIGGNSSDIVYPELMWADFTPQADGTWHVNARFVNDSAGYDDIEVYDREFYANVTEVGQINNALYDGLDNTSVSEDTIYDLYLFMGFSVDIIYDDGSWISLITLQDEEGHLILMSGVGEINGNLLDGTVLEPSSALDGLVNAIRTVFEIHLG